MSFQLTVVHSPVLFRTWDSKWNCFFLLLQNLVKHTIKSAVKEHNPCLNLTLTHRNNKGRDGNRKNGKEEIPIQHMLHSSLVATIEYFSRDFNRFLATRIVYEYSIPFRLSRLARRESRLERRVTRLERRVSRLERRESRLARNATRLVTYFWQVL